jgi:hypothetical protein
MKSLLIIISIALLLTSPVYGQETIASARELYFSASYEDALGVLSRLDAGGPSPDRLTISQYKAYCLLALGKMTEAEQAIEAVVSADPFFQPADSDVSPRLRSAFAAVRIRLLPAIIQQEYAHAKSAFDRGDFVGASTRFERVLLALADPDISLAAGRPPLSDLRTLAGGFRDLSVRAAAPPPPPQPVEAPKVAQVVARPNAIYTGVEAGLHPPITVRQMVPNFPRDLVSLRNGVLEVIIDESGNVENAVMRTPIHPRFDPLVLSSAKTWKYHPATVAGTPVKFRKTINIAMQPPSSR